LDPFRLPLSDPSLFLDRAQRPGQVFVYPTETFYALGCLANDPQGVEAIYRLKGRKAQAPLLVLVSGWPMLHRFVPRLGPLRRAFLERHWPGPLTVVLPSEGLAPGLNREGSEVGFRYSSYAPIRGLIEATGVPWVGTSANRSGEPPPARLNEALEAFPGQVELWLDGGDCPGGQASTLIRLNEQAQVTVLRPGAWALQP